MTNQADYPDWLRTQQQTAPATLFANAALDDSPAVTTDPIYVGTWPTTIITLIATAGGHTITVTFFADEALTIVLGGAVIEMLAGDFTAQAIPNVGPWMTVKFDGRTGVPVLNAAVVASVRAAHGEVVNMFARLVGAVDSGIAAGATLTLDAVVVYAGPATISGKWGGSLFTVQVVAVDGAGNETLTAHFDQRVGGSFVLGIHLPLQHLRVKFTNNDPALHNASIIVVPRYFQ